MNGDDGSAVERILVCGVLRCSFVRDSQELEEDVYVYVNQMGDTQGQERHQMEPCAAEPR
jgi:hypothetical protein